MAYHKARSGRGVIGFGVEELLGDLGRHHIERSQPNHSQKERRGQWNKPEDLRKWLVRYRQGDGNEYQG